jgi:hypothetical protein
VKLFIGIPGFAGIQPEAQQSVLRMLYRLGRDTDYDVVFSVITKSEQFRARNALVNAGLQASADYILMLDDDMIVPPDLAQRLIAHDKDVTGCLYYQRGGAFHPVIMKAREFEDGTFKSSFISETDPIITNPGLHQVDIIGGGCMLFKARVFDKLLEPYFWWEHNAGTDIHICRRLSDAGFEIWVDTSIELGHLSDKGVIDSRTIPLTGRVMRSVNDELYEDLKQYLQVDDKQILFMMDKANNRDFHAQLWKEKEREDFDAVADFYQDQRGEHLTNLALYNLNGEPSHIKTWALMPENALIKSFGQYIDYGSGLGHLSVPLSRKTAGVYAFDIHASDTLEFLRWRQREKCLNLPSYGLVEEVPMGAFSHDFHGAFMISVIEHLTQPFEVIKWITEHVRPGGFFACDWFVLGHSEDEPQHLDRHDPEHFPTWMEKHGWSMSPEHPWLFIRKE